MSEFQPEPLAPELLQLLAAEKSRPAPPAAMQSRVLERLGADLLADIPLSGPPGAGFTPTTPARPSSAMRLRRLPLTVGLVALGGLGGGGLHAWLHQARQQAALPVAVPAAPAPAATPVPAPDAQAVVVVSPPRHDLIETRQATPSSARRQTASVQSALHARGDSGPVARDNELASERALLEQARMALARGRPADALTLLSRHAHEFADGRLAEEREALTVLSLVANRQVDEARSAAARFKRKFPGSMLMRSIDAAFEANP